jgi:hypothetical protein
MSVHTNTPDMVRFTCWATTSTNKDGKATDDWGWFGSRKKKLPRTAQHHWEWAYGWTEFDGCERDEWTPRYFWSKNAARPSLRARQVIRLIHQPDNSGAGQLWKEFNPKHDAWEDAGKQNMGNGAATTTSSKIVQRIGGGTTSRFRNLCVMTVMLKKVLQRTSRALVSRYPTLFSKLSTGNTQGLRLMLMMDSAKTDAGQALWYLTIPASRCSPTTHGTQTIQAPLSHNVVPYTASSSRDEWQDEVPHEFWLIFYCSPLNGFA